jgi:hypothetical protein
VSSSAPKAVPPRPPGRQFPPNPTHQGLDVSSRQVPGWRSEEGGRCLKVQPSAPSTWRASLPPPAEQPFPLPSASALRTQRPEWKIPDERCAGRGKCRGRVRKGRRLVWSRSALVLRTFGHATPPASRGDGRATKQKSRCKQGQTHNSAAAAAMVSSSEWRKRRTKAGL